MTIVIFSMRGVCRLCSPFPITRVARPGDWQQSHTHLIPDVTGRLPSPETPYRWARSKQQKNIVAKRSPGVIVHKLFVNLILRRRKRREERSDDRTGTDRGAAPLT